MNDVRETYNSFKEVAMAAKEAKKEFEAAIKSTYGLIEDVTVYSYTSVRLNTAYHSVDFYVDRTEEAEITKNCNIDMQSIETEEEALEYFRKVKEDREALEIALKDIATWFLKG